MTVTKETILKRINEDTGWSRHDSKKAMQKLLGIMFRALSNGEDILISGFGKFKVLHKMARLGRNPHTLEEIQLKARKVVSFKASENLRRKTNQTFDALANDPQAIVEKHLAVDDIDDFFPDEEIARAGEGIDSSFLDEDFDDEDEEYDEEFDEEYDED
ncbi:MAG: HU family DNA-binding protein [Deltaproteobacteria bacterium]|jgi:integration host factor subunit alpha|nr:HU family DNA-binding protein [Deltaproteobacteria bacterium]